MPTPTALLVETIHQTAHEGFSHHGIGVHTMPAGLSEDALLEAIAGLPGDGPVVIGIRSKTLVTKSLMENSPRLTAVGAFCIGTDQIQLSEARALGVPVFNAPFSNTRSVAELVIGEVIMLGRQIFRRSTAAHGGNWQKTTSGAHEVRGKTLGIIGYGHIGSQLSVLAEALGLKVIYHDVVAKLPLGNAEARTSLAALLTESDFVTLHVPDTEQTRMMIKANELAAMKPGAYLINASRGSVVDLEALRDALSSGHLAGAAIDVYPEEPSAAGETFESPLRGLDNVILTPHIGGSTHEAQANIGREVSEALSAYMRHGKTAGSVNMPELDPPELRSGCRIVNIHRNVPGVLSAINQAVAASEMNIVGQRLATRDEVGLLVFDLKCPRSDERVLSLVAAISALETSIRTSLV